MTESWRQFFQEGDSYLRVAQGGVRRPKIFTPEVVYNLAAMALEKHIMAVLIYNGTLADNHTFEDLVDSADRCSPLPPDVRERLLALQKHQQICSPYDGYSRDVLTREVADDITRVASDIHVWARQKCVVT
jgi:hypothetical protein